MGIRESISKVVRKVKPKDAPRTSKDAATFQKGAEAFRESAKESGLTSGGKTFSPIVNKRGTSVTGRASTGVRGGASSSGGGGTGVQLDTSGKVVGTGTTPKSITKQQATMPSAIKQSNVISSFNPFADRSVYSRAEVGADNILDKLGRRGKATAERFEFGRSTSDEGITDFFVLNVKTDTSALGTLDTGRGTMGGFVGMGGDFVRTDRKTFGSVKREERIAGNLVPLEFKQQDLGFKLQREAEGRLNIKQAEIQADINLGGDFQRGKALLDVEVAKEQDILGKEFGKGSREISQRSALGGSRRTEAGIEANLTTPVVIAGIVAGSVVAPVPTGIILGVSGAIRAHKGFSKGFLGEDLSFKERGLAIGSGTLGLFEVGLGTNIGSRAIERSIANEEFKLLTSKGFDSATEIKFNLGKLGAPELGGADSITISKARRTSGGLTDEISVIQLGTKKTALPQIGEIPGFKVFEQTPFSPIRSNFGKVERSISGNLDFGIAGKKSVTAFEGLDIGGSGISLKLGKGQIAFESGDLIEGNIFKNLGANVFKPRYRSSALTKIPTSQKDLLKIGMDIKGQLPKSLKFGGKQRFVNIDESLTGQLKKDLFVTKTGRGDTIFTKVLNAPPKIDIVDFGGQATRRISGRGFGRGFGGQQLQQQALKQVSPKIIDPSIFREIGSSTQITKLITSSKPSFSSGIGGLQFKQTQVQTGGLQFKQTPIQQSRNTLLPKLDVSLGFKQQGRSRGAQISGLGQLQIPSIKQDQALGLGQLQQPKLRQKQITKQKLQQQPVQQFSFNGPALDFNLPRNFRGFIPLIPLPLGAPTGIKKRAKSSRKLTRTPSLFGVSAKGLGFAPVEFKGKFAEESGLVSRPLLPAKKKKRKKKK